MSTSITQVAADDCVDDDPQQRGQKSDASNEEDDVRCDCGSLLARRQEEAIEIKCRRCKRILVIEVTWRGIRVSRD
jgi:hypothetical protein